VSYLSLTDADREAMLNAIGVDSVEALFEQIPAGVHFDRELDLEPPLSEQELVAHLEELAARNVDTGREVSFLGAGIYDHYVPALVDTVLSRGEFLTAYTPYQAEMSQGVLQAIFEYQTAICELTGMDVSNASGYDGTTVAGDACYVAKHVTGRAKVVVTEATNPQVRQVVKTYAVGFGLEVVEVPHRAGVTDPEEVRRAAVVEPKEGADGRLEVGRARGAQEDRVCVGGKALCLRQADRIGCRHRVSASENQNDLRLRDERSCLPRCHPHSAMPHSRDRRAVPRLRGDRSALPGIAGALRRSLLGLRRCHAPLAVRSGGSRVHFPPLSLRFPPATGSLCRRARGTRPVHSPYSVGARV